MAAQIRVTAVEMMGSSQGRKEGRKREVKEGGREGEKERREKREKERKMREIHQWLPTGLGRDSSLSLPAC